MPGLERNEMERLLLTLEARGELFPEFSLVQEQSTLSLLGSGGFSVVYEMRSRNQPNARYALKVAGIGRHTVSSEHFLSTVKVQRFLMESSGYIVRILDAKELWVLLSDGGAVCGVLDCPPEGHFENILHLQLVLMNKLDTIVVKDRFHKVRLSRPELGQEAEVLKLGLQIGQALHCAHTNQILHRDIKLENIFWDAAEGRYKLGDFGSAKYTQDGSAETLIYTDGYGAPEIERVLSDRYDSAADIYSLGITLYLLLNDLKFPGSDGYRASPVQYHPDFTFPAPEHASQALTRVLRKMCSYRKEDRYRTMSEVLAALVQASEIHADQWDDADWMDFPTETYRASKDAAPSQAQTRQNTRADRLLEERAFQNSARRQAYYLGFWMVLACYLSIPTLGADGFSVSQWQFWLLPAALILDWAFLLLGDLKLAAGLASAGIVVWSVVSVGFTPLHFLAFAFLAAQLPISMFSLAAAILLWVVVPLQTAWILWPAEHDCGWLLVTVLLAMSYRGAVLRTGKNTVIPKAGFKVISAIPFLLVIAGIVAWVLGKVGLWQLPQALQTLHPVPTGLCSYALFMISYQRWTQAETEVET